jgi:hypothetical protein
MLAFCRLILLDYIPIVIESNLVQLAAEPSDANLKV